MKNYTVPDFPSYVQDTTVGKGDDSNYDLYNGPANDEQVPIEQKHTYFQELLKKVEHDEQHMAKILTEIAAHVSYLCPFDLDTGSFHYMEGDTVMERLHTHYMFREQICERLYNLYGFIAMKLYGKNVEDQVSLQKSVHVEEIICLKQLEELFISQMSFMLDIIALINNELSDLFTIKANEKEISSKKEKGYFFIVLCEGNELILDNLNELLVRLRQIF